MEKVFFENIGKTNIFCYFSEPQEKQTSMPKGLIIMCHGFRGTSVGPARQFVDFQHMLNQAGFAVLRFDQPNSGNSDGDYILSSFNRWVDTIVSLTTKYLNLGYEVSLLGQSMGASAATVASNNPKLQGKIPTLLLWVPDPKSTVNIAAEQVFEEGGQKYHGRFWTEARDSNFTSCLQSFEGNIHLVYGEKDRYVAKKLREKTMQIVRSKGQVVTILPGEDHSPWTFAHVREIFRTELLLLKQKQK